MCSGVDDSWYCEPGSVCGLTSGSCNNFYTGDDPCESNAAVSESGSATGSAGPEETGSSSDSGSSTTSADAAAGTQSQTTQTGAAGRVEVGRFGGALAVGLAEAGLGVWGFVVGL